jgi:hypothetical protein
MEVAEQGRANLRSEKHDKENLIVDDRNLYA